MVCSQLVLTAPPAAQHTHTNSTACPASHSSLPKPIYAQLTARAEISVQLEARPQRWGHWLVWTIKLWRVSQHAGAARGQIGERGFAHANFTLIRKGTRRSADLTDKPLVERVNKRLRRFIKTAWNDNQSVVKPFSFNNGSLKAASFVTVMDYVSSIKPRT